ncbi:MAG TPA: NUDIX domain-containing protein [Candidatus Saccharimonadia bacterium]|nr:NUDIX domain-containing protein [Candidatus Saccharimonadia bacterium]
MTYVIPETAIRRQAEADGITHLSTGIAVAYDGKILVVRRTPDDFLGGSYELPGGGVDPGETLTESVARELLEETNLRLTRVVAMFPGFEYSTPSKPKVRQLNFLVETEGHEVQLSAEHDDFVFVDEKGLKLLEMTGPMKDCFKNALSAADSFRANA